jgi:hypothetical protein
MIRKIIRPQQNSFTINIPNEYINQEVEFILFPLNTNEMMQPIYKLDKPENITNSLFGALKDSNINQTDYKDYLEEKYL